MGGQPAKKQHTVKKEIAEGVRDTLLNSTESEDSVRRGFKALNARHILAMGEAHRTYDY